LIERSLDFYEFPLVDRYPVSAWTRGRVTLIGDAAHPMQPIGSQAGPQAIVDTRALTGALTATPDLNEALAQYDAKPAKAFLRSWPQRSGAKPSRTNFRDATVLRKS
jgi:2-polyprenyl-6-methoxyphenol hydroxylase-like FAD-dependent oxidoreductase